MKSEPSTSSIFEDNSEQQTKLLCKDIPFQKVYQAYKDSPQTVARVFRRKKGGDENHTT